MSQRPGGGLPAVGADGGGARRNLARALRTGPFDVGELDLEAFTDDRSEGMRLVLARMGAAIAAVLFVYCLVVLPLASEHGYTPQVVAVLAAVAGGSAWTLARYGARIPMVVFDLLLVAIAPLLAFMSWFGAGASTTGVVVLVGTCAMAVRRLRVALFHVAFLVAMWALVLAAVADFPHRGAHWLFVVLDAITVGLVVRWLVQRVAGVIQAEHAARQAAERLRAELAAASVEQSAFLARMSHELRTPLNAVLGFSQVLDDELYGPLDDRQRGYVRDIEDSGRHLLALVDDVLDLARVEAGRDELDLRPVDPVSVARDALSMVRDRAARQGVAMRLECDPAIGPVVADERKLRQVVLNLLANALHAMPCGGELVVVAGPAGADARGIELGVRDTGPGVPEADRHRIFERYEQGAGGGGVGLGLDLVRRIVVAHGGRVWVDTAPGGGAWFRVSLPPEPSSTSQHGTDATTAVAGDDGQFAAWIEPGSRPNRDLAARICALLAVAGTVMGIVLVALGPAAGVPRSVFAGLVVVAGSVAVATAVFGGALPAGALVAMGTFGTAAITVAVHQIGPLSDLVALLYPWVLLPPAVYSNRVVVGQGVIAMAAYLAVLLVRPGDGAVLAPWLSVVVLTTTSGAIPVWLVAKLRSVVVAERAQRRVVEEAAAQLRAVARHKKEFLAGTSHELRTPLNAIIGFAAVLRDGIGGTLDERRTGYAADIEEAGRHLLALVDDLLDLARLDAGRLHVERGPVVVADVVARAAAQVAPAAQAKGVSLATVLGDAVELVEGDPARLEQALERLVANAVRFTPPGGEVTVRAAVEADDVVIAVSDTGPGVADVDRDRIFDAFQGEGGAGLGLTLARALTELHGGTLTVRSTTGEGSTFRMVVPLAGSSLRPAGAVR